MSEARPPALPRAVRIGLGAAFAAYLAAAGWLVWRTAILEPYSDMYDWLARWYQLQADGDLGRYLWAPHNLHHLVWTFMVLALDVRAFGGSGYLFLAVGVLCLAATAAMLARAAAAAAGEGLRSVGVVGATALSLMGCHVLDATSYITTPYLHTLVFAVAAILLAEGPGDRSTLRRGCALACAMAAGLGSGAGLAVWPALVFAAWRGQGRGWTFTVLATGALFSLVYALGQGSPANAVAGGVRHGAKALMLFINYLGLPWLRAYPRLGWLMGLIVLGLALMAIAFKGRRGAPWQERAAVPLILFSLGTAMMAAIGRTGVTAPDQVPMRYAVFMIPLHVGLWILALPYLRRAWQRRPAPVAGAIAAASVFMLVHQAAMGVFAVRTSDINRQVIADFQAGKRTPAMLTTIYFKLGVAEATSERVRRDGIYQRELRPAGP